MKTPNQLIEAPSVLGLKPLGVELLPYALQRNGFLRGTPPPLAVPVEVTDFSSHRASVNDVLNAEWIAEYSSRLAGVIRPVLDRRSFWWCWGAIAAFCWLACWP